MAGAVSAVDYGNSAPSPCAFNLMTDAALLAREMRAREGDLGAQKLACSVQRAMWATHFVRFDFVPRSITPPLDNKLTLLRRP